MGVVLRAEEKIRLLECNQCYMLGTLASNEEEYPGVGEEQKPVTVMKNSNNVLFYIQSLSMEPDPIIELLDGFLRSNLYIGIDQKSQNIFPMTYKFTDDIEQKEQIVEDTLKGKLILFKPYINFKSKDYGEDVFKNIEIITLESDVKFSKNTQYVSVPKINMNNDVFEEKLLDGSNILLEDYNHAMLEPECIICGNYLYSNFPKWSKHKDNKKMWYCSEGSEKIKRIKLNINDKDSRNYIIRGSENVLFIENMFLYDISSKIENEGEYITNLTEKDNNTQKEEDSEVKFLKAFKEYTVIEQLCYSYKDLINFHISVKTNPLTILAGMSGTGKTQLALAYAKMLGLTSEDGTLLILPISPSYTEPGDLLGYLNTTNGLFTPSEAGLTDFLIHAEKNIDKMHMVIFDEMNLSQVEHWFAPFISLLELKPEQRKLSLYINKTICYNSEKYPNSINIGKNVIFIGTINMDETTKDFSDRLLDRANIVVLNKKSFKELKQEQDDIKNKDKTYEASICYSREQFNSWFNNKKTALDVYTLEELEFLDDLHKLIQDFDNQKGVSFRIFKNMGNYLNNIPVNENGEDFISRKDAFDIQIKQRILTKIKGTEQQFENLIGKMQENSDVPCNSKLYKFFNTEEAQKISDFELTKKEIIRKAKELSIYGYAN